MGVNNERSNTEAETGYDEHNAQTLAEIMRLIAICRLRARSLVGVDTSVADELLDTLALAEISACRLLSDNEEFEDSDTADA